MEMQKKLLNKLKKNLNIKFTTLMRKKRGIVYARNKCLSEVKKINCNYFSFLDDDCEIDTKWFVNFKKIINKHKVKIVTGPQIHKKNSKINNNLEIIFEKKINDNKKYVNWAATNNVILSKKIILSSNLKFDVNLNKFGMGEDQLFFLQLNKKRSSNFVE